MAWTLEQLLAALRIEQAKKDALEAAYSALDGCLARAADILEGEYAEHMGPDTFATEYLAKYTTAVGELQTAANAMGA